MARKLKSVFVFIMATVMMMSFQNCSDSSEQRDQEVFKTDLSLLLFEEDFSKNKVSLYSYDQKTNEESLFSVKRLDKVNVEISENKTNFLCSVKEENPFDIFLETIGSMRISHPSRVSIESKACSNFELPSQYLIVNVDSKETYIVFKNTSAQNCTSFNADLLIKSGKRVFIAENISSDEVNELVFQSQEMLDVLPCTEESSKSSTISKLFK